MPTSLISAIDQFLESSQPSYGTKVEHQTHNGNGTSGVWELPSKTSIENTSETFGGLSLHRKPLLEMWIAVKESHELWI